LWQVFQVGHESYQRHEEVRGSSNRSFGIVFAIVFALIGLLPLAFGGHARLWSLAVGAAFLLVALAAPSVLAPLNRLWLRFGLLLHRIVSPLILGIMFYLVVTPTGLLMRALGKDLLRLKFDRQRASYWIERVPPGPPPESIKDQF
jgi:predicted membrane metal-binding protein